MSEPLYNVRHQQWNDWLGGTAPVTWEGSAKRAGAWPLDEANALAAKHGGYVVADEERPTPCPICLGEERHRAKCPNDVA